MAYTSAVNPQTEYARDRELTMKWWLMTTYYHYTAQEYRVDIQVFDDVTDAIAVAKLTAVNEEVRVRILCVVNSVPDYTRSLYRNSEGEWA